MRQNRAIYGFAVWKDEYNIAKAEGFYIAFAVGQKYHCETCLTISLIIFIFEIGNISKYVTHYDTFKPKVSIFNKKKIGRALLYEVSS